MKIKNSRTKISKLYNPITDYSAQDLERDRQKGLPAKISVKSSAGFGAVEMLLLVLIVLVAAFAGYYVAHNHNQTKPVASASISTTKKSTTSTQKYFTITEWGVRAPYNGSLTLEYSVSAGSSLPGTAAFSSTQLDASDPQCKSGADYGGVVDQYRSTDEYQVGDLGSDSGQTAAEYAATLDSSTYGHVGSYYYFYVHPQGLCGSGQSSEDAQTQTQDAVAGLLSKLQAIPN